MQPNIMDAKPWHPETLGDIDRLDPGNLPIMSGMVGWEFMRKAPNMGSGATREVIRKLFLCVPETGFSQLGTGELMIFVKIPGKPGARYKNGVEVGEW